MLPPLFLDVQPHHRVSLCFFVVEVRAYMGEGHGYVRCSWFQGTSHFLLGKRAEFLIYTRQLNFWKLCTRKILLPLPLFLLDFLSPMITITDALISSSTNLPVYQVPPSWLPILTRPIIQPSRYLNPQ